MPGRAAFYCRVSIAPVVISYPVMERPFVFVGHKVSRILKEAERPLAGIELVVYSQSYASKSEARRPFCNECDTVDMQNIQTG